MNLGIDIGRVIIKGDTDEPNLFFSKDFLVAPAVEGAFSAIRQIVEIYGSKAVFLVSKCGESTESKTLQWLDYQGFYSQTGVLAENIRFCRERSEKQLICLENEIRIFIDDRYSVLKHLTQMQKMFLFDPIEKELESFQKAKDKSYIKLVNNWEEVLTYLR
jgi:hypothetical protein